MISIVLGTRPEIIKLSPLIDILKKKKYSFNILHTGQHYSNNLNDIFLKQLNIPENKIVDLNVGSHSHGKQTALIIEKIENFIKRNRSLKAVLVYGDTNSAFAATIAACKFYHIKIIHLEAGLRSFDKFMPEEINRRLIDHASDLLLCPTKIAKKNLINEGIKKNIFVTGNTIVDAIKYNLKKNNISSKPSPLNKYITLTIHREENTLQINQLKEILNSVEKIAIELNYDVFFPCHPKTRKLFNKITNKYHKIKIINPLDYISFLNLIKNSNLIISDSGGIQEEACILKVPIITIRKSTERPETLIMKCNLLSNSSYHELKKNVVAMLKQRINWSNPYGKGNSALLSFKIIKKFLDKNEQKSY